MIKGNSIRSSALAVGLGAVAVAALAQSASGPSKLAMTSSDFKFAPISPAPPGVTSVVPVGSLATKGIYVLRNKFPPNSSVPAHSHTGWRVMTVIEGTLYFAYGNKADVSQEKAYGPGSLIVEPIGVPHYFNTKADGAVIQFVGEGPLETHF